MQDNLHLPSLMSQAVPVPVPAAEVTWQSLVAIEPDLEVLSLEALIISKRKPFDWRVWEKVKRRLKDFVGPSAARAELRNQSSWAVCFDHLLALAEGECR